MARAGVVDRDVPKAAEARGQDLLLFGAERLEFGRQQPHHLALGDHHAGPVQQRQNPLTRHLSLKVQHQDQTMQMREPPASASKTSTALQQVFAWDELMRVLS
jgi:hypothetical protein